MSRTQETGGEVTVQNSAWAPTGGGRHGLAENSEDLLFIHIALKEARTIPADLLGTLATSPDVPQVGAQQPRARGRGPPSAALRSTPSESGSLRLIRQGSEWDARWTPSQPLLPAQPQMA